MTDPMTRLTRLMRKCEACAGTGFRFDMEGWGSDCGRCDGTGEVPATPLVEDRPCRRCGAPMIWAVTVTGGRMPVDRDPTETGNVRLSRLRDWATGEVVAVRATVVPPGSEAGLRLPHHATCPHADEFRRGAR